MTAPTGDAAMMGTRDKLNENEIDAFTRHARRVYSWGPGVLRRMKRQFWHRQRAAQHREERELVKRGGDGGE